MKEIYEEIYGGLIYDDNHKPISHYGTGNHGKHTLNYILGKNPESVLDVGCGRGNFVYSLFREGVRAVGVDFAVKSYYVGPKYLVANARNLPFPDNSFTIVTSFDMMEHLQENEVEKVIGELWRVCQTEVVMTICFRDSVFRVRGKSLHSTIRPAKWWKEKLQKFFQIKFCKGNTFYLLK